MFRRTNNKNKRGYVRDQGNTDTTTTYANTPRSRRNVNTSVNKKHGRYPSGWYSTGCEEE